MDALGRAQLLAEKLLPLHVMHVQRRQHGKIPLHETAEVLPQMVAAARYSRKYRHRR
jgi:hypothetical protein